MKPDETVKVILDKEKESGLFPGKFHLGGGYYSSKDGGEAEFKNDKGNLELIYNSKKYGILCERRFEVDSNSMVIGFVSNGCF